MQDAKNTTDKILGYVGLAARAGKLAKGADSVLDGLARGKISLVVIASDAGRSIASTVSRVCREQNIPVISVIDKSDLGKQLGREAYAVVGISSKDLARGIIELIDTQVSTAD